MTPFASPAQNSSRHLCRTFDDKCCIFGCESYSITILLFDVFFRKSFIDAYGILGPVSLCGSCVYVCLWTFDDACGIFWYKYYWITYHNISFSMNQRGVLFKVSFKLQLRKVVFSENFLSFYGNCVLNICFLECMGPSSS